MKKHYYLYYNKNFVNLMLWFLGLSFGISMTWSDGLFVFFHLHKQMGEEEYTRVRDEQTNE